MPNLQAVTRDAVYRTLGLLFTTIRVGDERIRIITHDVSMSSLARLLSASDGSFWMLSGALAGPYATEAEAVAQVADVATPELQREVRWRSDLVPLEGEGGCPLCAAPVVALARYPRAICPACELEATDAAERRVRFGNVDLRGGLRGVYLDDGSAYTEQTCTVRWRACRAEEGRFGGVVLQLCSPV